MAEIFCGVVSENEGSSSCESGSSSRPVRRKRMDVLSVKLVDGVQVVEADKPVKQARMSVSPSSFPRESDDVVVVLNNGNSSELKPESEDDGSDDVVATVVKPSEVVVEIEPLPKFGFSSVCGRRRDMEDAIAIYPSFFTKHDDLTENLHYFGVYDGHGCSHVATRCKDRLHLLVKEELDNKVESMEWAKMMELCFNRMDQEVIDWNHGSISQVCRCELRAPKSDAVGSTAVLAIITPDKIVVANCGDSRAVLSRNGTAVPLSIDHKPDRPDELNRIEEAGGRVIYWDGARVLGVLATSRAIGDNYLKPFVICEPEVTVTDRTSEDEFLIIASDGLWDVVANDTACGVVRMCLNGRESAPNSVTEIEEVGTDKACSDASILLTKIALARRTTDNVSVVVIDLREK